MIFLRDLKSKIQTVLSLHDFENPKGVTEIIKIKTKGQNKTKEQKQIKQKAMQAVPRSKKDKIGHEEKLGVQKK